MIKHSRPIYVIRSIDDTCVVELWFCNRFIWYSFATFSGFAGTQSENWHFKAPQKSLFCQENLKDREKTMYNDLLWLRCHITWRTYVFPQKYKYHFNIRVLHDNQCILYKYTNVRYKLVVHNNTQVLINAHVYVFVEYLLTVYMAWGESDDTIP